MGVRVHARDSLSLFIHHPKKSAVLALSLSLHLFSLSLRDFFLVFRACVRALLSLSLSQTLWLYVPPQFAREGVSLPRIYIFFLSFFAIYNVGFFSISVLAARFTFGC